MTDIYSAADDITIEIEPDSLRIIAQGYRTRRVIAQASRDQPFRYDTTFSGSRFLPTDLQLQPNDIAQVTLGWSPQTRAWHLGLVLTPSLAQQRRSRWCELVKWLSPQGQAGRPEAERVGQHLAHLLKVPFRVVEPSDVAQSHEQTPLSRLPLRFGLWTLQAPASDNETNTAPHLYQMRLSPRWYWSQYLRAGWYAFWAVVYVWLSLTTLQSDIALPNAGTLLPNPQILPYIGLGTAALLVGLALYTLVSAARHVNRIDIDPATQQISAWRGQRPHWQIQQQDVQSVYVSEVVRRKKQIEHGELNFQREDGSFALIATLGDSETLYEKDRPEASRRNKDAVVSLERDTSNSPLQDAALYLAHALGDIPCWYDVRRK